MADDTAAHRNEPVNEYEREPVPKTAWLGFSSFVGQYAGEHTAGTELMIGPLFIASGVSAASVVGGLFVGNLLAVLSWMLLTAPIATRARLTLYYQLEKICGRNLVTATTSPTASCSASWPAPWSPCPRRPWVCGSTSRCRH